MQRNEETPNVRPYLRDLRFLFLHVSAAEVSRMKPPLVPLATLIGRELRNEKVEKPFVKFGQAALAKKGEDYFLVKPDCQRVPGNPATTFSVFAVGPLRCWPGGLCLSRSIGDTDVGEFIVPIPHVKQVKLSNAGGRLIIASDGIWDALSSAVAAKSCRGLPADLAAKLVVKEALRSRGLKDDTTCLVVDIIPCDHPVLPPTPRKKQNVFSSLLFGKRSQNSTNKTTNKLSVVGVVEELFEEGSAMLAERYSFVRTFLCPSNLFFMLPFAL
ncbi:PPM-type phosphatase-like domain - like 10 [Theobroma cacao]|nr:PPM-type phosphatase-like domain - like 10 [Theobroma cacao]